MMLRDQSFDATGRVGYTIKGQDDLRYGTSESPARDLRTKLQGRDGRRPKDRIPPSDASEGRASDQVYVI